VRSAATTSMMAVSSAWPLPIIQAVMLPSVRIVGAGGRPWAGEGLLALGGGWRLAAALGWTGAVSVGA
jgi:hypothetical protein